MIQKLILQLKTKRYIDDVLVIMESPYRFFGLMDSLLCAVESIPNDHLSIEVLRISIFCEKKIFIYKEKYLKSNFTLFSYYIFFFTINKKHKLKIFNFLWTFPKILVRIQILLKDEKMKNHLKKIFEKISKPIKDNITK